MVMTNKLSLLAVVLFASLLQLSQSFTTTATAARPALFGITTTATNQRGTRLFGKSDRDKEGGGGGAAIAKPKIAQKTAVETKTRQKVEIKRKIKPAEPVQRKEDDFEDAPMYKLMLLGDDGYDPTHVIDRLCAIIEDIDEDQAATVFQQANSEGKAMCGKFPFERAELFMEQLQRSDPMIFSIMEEENA